MSYIYYTSGERDDDTNEYVTPAKWKGEPANLSKLLNAEPKPEMKGKPVPLPREFDDDYYEEKRDKYIRQSREYWDWDRMRIYADKVYFAYKLLSRAFIANFELKEVSFPDWAMDGSSKNVDIDKSIENLNRAEIELVRQFYKYRERSIIAQFNKHSALRKVQACGAEAWMMFHSLRGDVPVKSSLLFNERLKNLNLNVIEDALIAYRGCIVLSRQLNLYVKPRIIDSQHGLNEIYSNLDSLEVYDKLMKKIGCITSTDIADIKSRVEPMLRVEAKSNSIINKVMNFYDRMDSILKLSYDIRRVTNRVKDNYESSSGGIFLLFPYFQDGDDLFVLGKEYLEYLDKMIKIDYPSKFIMYDINNVYKDLSSVMKQATPWYNRTHEVDDLIDDWKPDTD